MWYSQMCTERPLECAGNKTVVSSHSIGKPLSANLSPSQGLSLIFVDMYRPVFIADIVTEAKAGSPQLLRTDYTRLHYPVQFRAEGGVCETDLCHFPCR